MENILLYNELVLRGCSVDVGTVRYAETKDGVKLERQHEIDFVVNRGMKRIYIQSAFSVESAEKKNRK